MRYRNLWSCLILFTLLSTFGLTILAEDGGEFELFIQAQQAKHDYSIPADDKDDTLYLLRVDATNPMTGVATVLGYGSTINIGNDEFITASHCVDFAVQTELFIRTKDGWMECTKLACDRELDVALIRCKTHIDNPAIKLDDKEHSAGAAKVYGTPWGAGKQRYDAELTPSKTRGLLRGPHLLSPQVCPGCSGGAIVFDHKVIGMSQAITTKAGGDRSGDVYYVSSKDILEWLKGARKELEKQDGNKGAVVPEAGK